MALQMHKVSTNAPFFKPPSSSQGSNYFALSSLSLVQTAPHSEQNRQTQQHQRQQQSSQSNNTSSYFKTTSVQSQDTRKQKGRWDLPLTGKVGQLYIYLLSKSNFHWCGSRNLVLQKFYFATLDFKYIHTVQAINIFCHANHVSITH